MSHIDLQGQTAVVTGAARGIGFAIANRLVLSGAKVSIWDVDADAAEAAARELSYTGHAFAVPVDLTDPIQIDDALARTLEECSKVDILVNNAGIAGPNAPLWEYPIDQWQKVIKVDLDSVFLCCRAVVPIMLKHNYGRIVNIASIAGKEGNPSAAAYSAAKAGVIALTKSLGKELADRDIAVNCVTPAAARTSIFDQMSQSHIEYMLSKIPRKRFVELEEVASMVAWMVSAENSFTTGAVFDLSGGRATY